MKTRALDMRNWSRRGAAGLALAALLAAAHAGAQANKLPGPQDFPAFAKFISDRNIFDPGRQPHYYGTGRRTGRRVRNQPPDLQLVGTMSYEKGLFAFFNGNNNDLKKAVRAGEKLGDFTVTGITLTNAVLELTGKKEQLALNVGGGLRQENGKWVSFDGSEFQAAAGDSAPDADGAANASNSDNSSTPPAPSANEPNDVLKRLMQQREKENQ